MYLSVIIITTQDRPSDGNSEEWAEDWYMCHRPVSWHGAAAARIYLRMADKQLRLSLSSKFYLAQLAFRSASVWG